MSFEITKAAGLICLLAGLAGCQSPCLPCVSGWTRPAPIYVDHEGFCSLERQIDCLNHRFKPYEKAMDHCHFPKGVCKRLIKIDNDLQHANAELISREVAPEKMQRELNFIYRDLSWVEARTCIAPVNCCNRTIPAEQTERLDTSWLSKLPKFITHRDATPKTPAPQQSKSPAPTPSHN